MWKLPRRVFSTTWWGRISEWLRPELQTAVVRFLAFVNSQGNCLGKKQEFHFSALEIKMPKQTKYLEWKVLRMLRFL